MSKGIYGFSKSGKPPRNWQTPTKNWHPTPQKLTTKTNHTRWGAPPTNAEQSATIKNRVASPTAGGKPHQPDVPSGEKATKSFVTCDHATPTHLPRVGNGHPGPCKQSTNRHRLAGPPQNCYHKAAGNQNAVAKPETTVSASNALKNWLLQFPTSPDLQPGGRHK